MSRILVVDDEEAYRRLMAKHLERKGFEVESAGDGQTALAVLEGSEPFDVLVTDLMMPGMSGLELLEEVKRRRPEMEVIVITASDDVENAVLAMREDGAYDYLLKPLSSISELSFAVGRAVQHRTLLMESRRLSERLAAEAARFDAVIQATGDAMIAADDQDRIIIANPAAKELLGRQDIESHAARDVLPQELLGLMEDWKAIGVSAPTVVEVGWPGTAVQSVSLTPIEGHPAAGQGWLMVLRDITHLRRLDELKLRMLTEAAGRIRLPLAQATTKLAQLASAPSSEEQSRAAIYQLSEVLANIQGWIGEILGLVRIEAGLGFEQKQVALESVLSEELKRHFEETYRDKHLKLVIDLDPNLPPVWVDPGLMQKMIRCLVHRAAARSMQRGLIRVEGRARHDTLWIQVSDEGMNRERQPEPSAEVMLFSPEEKVGLEMVRAIAYSMGGRVWVRGHGLQGSTIAVSLPVAAREGRAGAGGPDSRLQPAKEGMSDE